MLAAGTRLGPYEITAALGAGGMGGVYRAHDSRLGRDVAVKVLQAASTHSAGSGQNVLFLVMELVEGEDLAQRLKRGRVSVDEALEIAKQIALAVEDAHEKGIVHRDLKPANIKVRPDRVVKVLDFGTRQGTGTRRLGRHGG